MNTRRSRGMVLLELAVAIAVAGFLVLAGMRTLTCLLERMSAQANNHSEQAVLIRLESGIRRAWEHRASHVLQAGDWLVIEGRERDDGTVLRSLGMRIVSVDGSLQEWRLFRENGTWRIEIRSAGASDDPGTPMPVGWEGDIVIDHKPGTFRGGQVPDSLHWRFPGARDRGMQAGFAIRALW